MIRRGFRLPQRLHLRTLKNFVSEKSGKRCEKIGATFYKIGKPGNFEKVNFFPVFAPDVILAHYMNLYKKTNCFTE